MEEEWKNIETGPDYGSRATVLSVEGTYRRPERGGLGYFLVGRFFVVVAEITTYVQQRTASHIFIVISLWQQRAYYYCHDVVAACDIR